ncbi:hypothetical protein [Aneurinibacillus soli]|uniref:hypothetical protein n=1 Tax=Aneurinibacillus soli TaxID=1500254 RepID=UPI001E3181D1|nr:hypothetical protein [Aneurinibacillus soli]
MKKIDAGKVIAYLQAAWKEAKPDEQKEIGKLADTVREAAGIMVPQETWDLGLDMLSYAVIGVGVVSGYTGEIALVKISLKIEAKRRLKFKIEFESSFLISFLISFEKTKCFSGLFIWVVIFLLRCSVWLRVFCTLRCLWISCHLLIWILLQSYPCVRRHLLRWIHL